MPRLRYQLCSFEHLSRRGTGRRKPVEAAKAVRRLGFTAFTAFTGFTAFVAPTSASAPPCPHRPTYRYHHCRLRAGAAARSENRRSMHRTALFCRDRTYRYRLGRRKGDGAAVCFVLLNPNTADETRGPDHQAVHRLRGAPGLRRLRDRQPTRTSRRTPRTCGRAGYPVRDGTPA